jgi:guanyl-specific ribonuclease Sa
LDGHSWWDKFKNKFFSDAQCWCEGEEAAKKIAAVHARMASLTQDVALKYIVETTVAYNLASAMVDSATEQTTRDPGQELLEAAQIPLLTGGTSALANQLVPAIVPITALNTLSYVDRMGQAPFGNSGGRTFENDGRQGGTVLPKTNSAGKPIAYTEWDVNSSLSTGKRDAKRIVRGSDGSAYYTGDHYTTFTRIR